MSQVGQETLTPLQELLSNSGSLDGNQHTLILTVLVLIGLLVPAGLMTLGYLAHRNIRTSPAKQQPFECGLGSVVGSADERFSVKFYMIAMLFLIFDLEVAFLFPWAVHFNSGGWEMLGLLLVFLVILEAGYLYLFRKGALDWDD